MKAEKNIQEKGRDTQRETARDKEKVRSFGEEGEIENIDLQRKGISNASLNPNALINLSSQYVSVEFQFFT